MSRASKNEQAPSATESATRARNGALPEMSEAAPHLPEIAPPQAGNEVEGVDGQVHPGEEEEKPHPDVPDPGGRPRCILHPVLPQEMDDQRGEGEHDERRGEDDRCPPPEPEGHFRLEERVGVGASVDHEEGDEEQGQAARPP